MSPTGISVAILVTLFIGAGIAYIVWVCIVKPRVEGERHREARREANQTQDLEYIQEQAERVKDSAQSIKEHVTRLQQMAQARELAEKERQARHGEGD